MLPIQINKMSHLFVISQFLYLHYNVINELSIMQMIWSSLFAPDITTAVIFWAVFRTPFFHKLKFSLNAAEGVSKNFSQNFILMFFIFANLKRFFELTPS